jgi:hypothetical protein
MMRRSGCPGSSGVLLDDAHALDEDLDFFGSTARILPEAPLWLPLSP